MNAKTDELTEEELRYRVPTFSGLRFFDRGLAKGLPPLEAFKMARDVLIHYDDADPESWLKDCRPGAGKTWLLPGETEEEDL